MKIIQTINRKRMPKEALIAQAISASLFVTEFAYEVAKRWIPILRTNRKLFHQDARMALRRFEESITLYNNWIISATGTSRKTEIIRNISDELNEYADEELHNLMHKVEEFFAEQEVKEYGSIARLETLYYIFLLANINATENLRMVAGMHPDLHKFNHMKMEPQLRIITGIRFYILEKHAKGMEMTEDQGKILEDSIAAIIGQIISHCNEVCANNNVNDLYDYKVG